MQSPDTVDSTHQDGHDPAKEARNGRNRSQKRREKTSGTSTNDAEQKTEDKRGQAERAHDEQQMESEASPTALPARWFAAACEIGATSKLSTPRDRIKCSNLRKEPMTKSDDHRESKEKRIEEKHDEGKSEKQIHVEGITGQRLTLANPESTT